MWESDGPYTPDELRAMRRLIVASGIGIAEWVQRTRRSAEFVRSLSAEQAEVITTEALAVAAEPDDLGGAVEMAEAIAVFAGVAPAERQKTLWRLLLEFRHRHYPRSCDE
ncbi:MAG TPA: hypothetical protein VKV26_15230 [Dehalococcoidia bacterium]|nr:hypothetical protein [Dehalococcoidia bacterium]